MNGLAIITVLVAVGSTEANRITSGQPMEMQPVIGGFILGLFLFTLLAVNNDLGTKFCYLVIVGALLINGAGLFNALSPKGKK